MEDAHKKNFNNSSLSYVIRKCSKPRGGSREKVVLDGTSRLESRYLYLGIKWTLPAVVANQQTTAFLSASSAPPMLTSPQTPSPLLRKTPRGKHYAVRILYLCNRREHLIFDSFNIVLSR